MIPEVLSDIVAKNTQVLRPNNKINSSVVLEEKTLKIAECIASHSGKSVTRVLSSILDAAGVEFLGLYRGILSPEERKDFDQAVLGTFDDDQVFDFVSLSAEEVVRYANMITWFPTDEGKSKSLPVCLRAENRDGVFGVCLSNGVGFLPLPLDEVVFDEDTEFRGESFYFSKVRPCEEKNINAVFSQARWMELDGWIHFIDEGFGIENLFVSTTPSYHINADFSVDQDRPFPELPGFSFFEEDRCYQTTVKPSLWTCVNSEHGLWTYEGRQYRFLLDQDLIIADQEATDDSE